MCKMLPAKIRKTLENIGILIVKNLIDSKK